MERDCTLFKVQHQGNKVTSKKVGLYEEFTLLENFNTASLLGFSWVDPIKYKDKIISKYKKTIFFLFFYDAGIVCFFSNSESDLFYVISKLNTDFMIDVKKINLFSRLEKSLSFQSEVFKTVAIQIVGQIGDLEKTTIYSYEDTHKVGFSEVIKRGSIAHLEYFDKEARINFSVDCNSIISFYDTDTFEEIKIVLEGVVEYFENDQ